MLEAFVYLRVKRKRQFFVIIVNGKFIILRMPLYMFYEEFSLTSNFLTTTTTKITLHFTIKINKNK